MHYIDDRHRGRAGKASVNLQPIWLEVIEVLVEVYQVRCASQSDVHKEKHNFA